MKNLITTKPFYRNFDHFNSAGRKLDSAEIYSPILNSFEMYFDLLSYFKVNKLVKVIRRGALNRQLSVSFFPEEVK